MAGVLSLEDGARVVVNDLDAAPERIAFCRFFAENLAGETAALRERAVDGGASLEAAAKTLFA